MKSLKDLSAPDAVGNIYVLQLRDDPDLYKIGRSGLGKVNDRFRRLRVGDALDVIFVGAFYRYRDWERAAHSAFRDRRLPQSEYFRLSRCQLSWLLKSLSSGNLDFGLGEDFLHSIRLQPGEGCILISDFDNSVAIDSSIADDFCLAVGGLLGKASLNPSCAFSEGRP